MSPYGTQDEHGIREPVMPHRAVRSNHYMPITSYWGLGFSKCMWGEPKHSVCDKVCIPSRQEGPARWPGGLPWRSKVKSSPSSTPSTANLTGTTARLTLALGPALQGFLCHLCLSMQLHLSAKMTDSLAVSSVFILRGPPSYGCQVF